VALGAVGSVVHRRWAVLGAGVALLACNAILGVEDVTQKGSATSSSGGSSGRDTSGGTSGGQQPVDLVPGTSGSNGTSGGNGTSGTNGGGDSGTDAPASVGCNGALDCERYVFVTHAAYTGALGGLAGADQKCTDAARATTLLAGRTFVAWLSDTHTGAVSRVAAGTKAYKRTDGAVIATSFTELTDAALGQPISLDENATALQGTIFDTSVWTATTATGQNNGDACIDWSSGDVTSNGGFGDSTSITVEWTEFGGSDQPGEGSCNSEKHLYCIEK
jgi:hypothetical protein